MRKKPDFVFRRNWRVHLNRRGRQFGRLLAAELCASAVVMLDTPCSEVVWRVLATHSIPLHFPSRASLCAITFQLQSTKLHIPKLHLSVNCCHQTKHHKNILTTITLYPELYKIICLRSPVSVAARSAATRLLKLWVRIPPGYGCLSVVSVVCCEVQVSGTSWSLVQRSPTDCGASLCVWSRNLMNEQALAHWGAVVPK